MALGSAIQPLLVKLGGDGSLLRKTYENAIAGAKRFQAKTNAALTQVAAKMKTIGASATRMGKTLALRVTAPLILMGVAALKAFSNFDKAMTESISIMKIVGDQAERMKKLALDLSGDVVQGPAELARSYFFLASAGLDAEEAMAALPVVSKFATAGAFDMARATDLLTDAQSALGLSIGSTADKMANMTLVGDTLVKANTLANASVEQFATALTSKAGAAFKAFNIPLSQGVALLATYADQGIKAELAGNSVDRMLRLLSKSVADNSEVFRELNVRVFDGRGEFREMADIILDLENATAGLSTEQKIATLTALGFEARVQAVILPLLGASQKTREYAKELTDVGNTMKDVADTQMTAFESQMKLVKDAVNLVAIDIGETLAPTILELGKFIKGVGIGWKNLSDTSKNWIIVVAAIAAAIGPLLIVFGFMSTSISSLITLYLTLAANAVIAKVAIIALNIAFTGLVFLGAAAIVLAIADAFGLLGAAVRDSAPQIELINKLMDNLLKATEKQIDSTKSLKDLEGTRKRINTGLDNATRIRLQNEEKIRKLESKVGIGGEFLSLSAGDNADLKQARLNVKEQKTIFDTLEGQLGKVNEIIQKKKTQRAVEEKPARILPPKERVLTDFERNLKRTNPREFNARQEPGGATAGAIAARRRQREAGRQRRQTLAAVGREERSLGIGRENFVGPQQVFTGPKSAEQEQTELLRRLVEIEEAKEGNEFLLPLDLGS